MKNENTFLDQINEELGAEFDNGVQFITRKTCECCGKKSPYCSVIGFTPMEVLDVELSSYVDRIHKKFKEAGWAKTSNEWHAWICPDCLNKVD